MKLRFFTIFCLSMFMMVGVTAAADDKEEKAKEAFHEGVGLFREGDYERAVTAFRRANALNSTWELQYNIGQSEAAAKRYGLAYEAFESYLSLGGDEVAETRRKEVVNELDRLLKVVGSVAVVAPDGATVLIDGFERGTLPLPGRLKVAVSVVHEVVIQKDGQTLHTEQVKVSRGEVVTVTVQGDDAPTEDEGSALQTEEDDGAAAADPTKPSRSVKKTIGVISLASGGALLVGAVVTGSIALSRNKELEADCTDNVCPSNLEDDARGRDSLALSTDILLGVGIAAAAVGVGLIIWSQKEARSKESSSTAITVSPIVGRETAGIGVTGSF